VVQRREEAGQTAGAVQAAGGTLQRKAAQAAGAVLSSGAGADQALAEAVRTVEEAEAGAEVVRESKLVDEAAVAVELEQVEQATLTGSFSSFFQKNISLFKKNFLSKKFS
jgi:hypothetical protein